MTIRYDTFAITSPGGRSINEDTYGFSSLENGRAFWIVADGLGGHSGGAMASRIAVSAISEWFRTRSRSAEFGLERRSLDSALRSAQAAIVAAREPPSARMYTTVAMLVTDGVAARWAHVGDSRLYHFRDSGLLAWTDDHSVPYLLYRAGEIGFDAIRTHKDRNRLVNTLGANEPWKPTILADPISPLRQSDAFILCTDGFWEHVLETEMEEDLATSTSAENWISAMERRIRNRTRIETGPEYDNYTAIAVRPISPSR
uniref:Serine/threonine protein phosphatase PrpC n=1 Tax=Candidatus Kentrum sp. TC TaxID=2126339 RepID=A0A450YBS4_9GAMM|nr:MAG: Serine/threonine protein phosphatase PrpC [Candidatus Kentron sp. TC]